MIVEVSKKEVLERIPEEWVEVRKFVEGRHEDDYYQIDEDLNELLIDEVFYGERQYLVKINLKRKEIQFIDDLVDIDAVLGMGYEVDVEEWEKSLKQLKEEVGLLGFRLVDIGNGGNHDYIWHALITDVSTFKVENLDKATELWDRFNREKRQQYEE